MQSIVVRSGGGGSDGGGSEGRGDIAPMRQTRQMDGVQHKAIGRQRTRQEEGGS
jgi:hypothetical protein